MPYEAQIKLNTAKCSLEKLHKAVRDIEEINETKLEKLKQADSEAHIKAVEAQKQLELAKQKKELQRKQALDLVNNLLRQLPMLKANAAVVSIDSNDELALALQDCKKSLDLAYFKDHM